MDESCWCGDELGIASVGVPAGVAGFGAQVLLPAHTESAVPAGVSKPRDTDAVPDADALADTRPQGDHLAHHFVPRGDVAPVHGQIAFGDVQVRAADPTGANGDQQLT